MMAAVVKAAGQGPVCEDVPEPVARRGEVVVSVTASALSHVARSRASGTHYTSEGRFPFVPGIDGTGRLPDGKRIYFFMPQAPNGALAERTVVEPSHLLKLPADLDDVTAASIAIPGVSSWAALSGKAQLRRGQTVLINGATGSAGRLAVKIAKHLGAGRVIATGRNPSALADLPGLGADEVLALTGDEHAMASAFERVFAAGVDVVLDYLWGDSARQLLIAAARAGDESRPLRYVEIGSASGPELALPAAVLRSSSIELLGSGLGSTPPKLLKQSLESLFAVARRLRLSVPTDVVRLSKIEAAWGAKVNTGRLVFVPDQHEMPAIVR